MEVAAVVVVAVVADLRNEAGRSLNRMRSHLRALQQRRPRVPLHRRRLPRLLKGKQLQKELWARHREHQSVDAVGAADASLVQAKRDQETARRPPLTSDGCP